MKKLLLMMLLLLPLCVMAQDETQPNTLVVYLTNGAKQEYPLQDSPEISFSGMDMVIKSGATTVVITRDEIARYQFAFRDDNNAIGQVATEKNIARRGNDVFIANVHPGENVTLFTLDGKVVTQTKADSKGEANVSLDSLGKGVYLLTVNNFTTKIIKQ